MKRINLLGHCIADVVIATTLTAVNWTSTYVAKPEALT